MAAGDGDDGTGGIDARTGDEVLVDRPLEAETGPTHVTHGGEAAHQRRGRLARGEQIVVADVAEGRGRRRTDQHRVPMRVDQPRHQHPAAAVDCLGVSRDVRGRYLLDLPVPDENIGRGGERTALSVEYPDVAEQNGGVLLGPRLRRETEARSNRHEQCGDSEESGRRGQIPHIQSPRRYAAAQFWPQVAGAKISQPRGVRCYLRIDARKPHRVNLQPQEIMQISHTTR
ncbi:hypothetical protein ABIF35_004842 [Bradyrhizobium japonicum]